MLECLCGYRTNNKEYRYCAYCGTELKEAEQEYVAIDIVEIEGHKPLVMVRINFKDHFCNCGNCIFERKNRNTFSCVKCGDTFELDMYKNMIENPDSNTVLAIRKRMDLNGGYCPCVPERTEDTKCPCKKFREEQICCCNLYIEEM